MQNFKKFVVEIKKCSKDRMGIKHKRRPKYFVSTNRVNKLFATYFSTLNISENPMPFCYLNKDKNDLLFLLRVYFKLWVELDKQLQVIKIFKKFPKSFKVIKEVNKQNHFFAPKTFPIGCEMHYVESGYNLSNRINGIPLAECTIPIKNIGIIPTTQINYEYIQAIH